MLPTGTVTFLFTDIEGSTPLWEQMPAAMQAAVGQHHAILHQAIESNNGHVFQILGDAFQASFRLATQALCAAIEAQSALQAAQWEATGPICVRMGIHTGPAELDSIPGPSGMHEYAVSHTLNRAARVMSAGHGGQILLSQEAMDLVDRELPEGVHLRDMGEHRLKGMLRLEHLYQVVAEGLPHDFPPLTTSAAIPNNLPSQLTSFIGREKELTALQELLITQKTRILTITGAGGTGKTRLALRAAEENIDSFPDGTWLVELASLTDPAIIPQTIAATLHLREIPNRPVIQVLCDYLSSKQLLLILDNCEHVVPAVSNLVSTLLHACPHLQILATSQQILGVDGECSFRCPPLNVPDLLSVHRRSGSSDLAAANASEGVQLFRIRAGAASPGFSITEKNAATVINICRRLDGIPLAIELAAARIRLLSVEQIAFRLDDAFRLLTGGTRSALPRHQTLQALIDWSYNLLTPPEKTLLQRLSVFSGSWDLEAAEQVAAGSRIVPGDVVDLMGQLVEKSLILVDSAEAGENRYRLLETIRRYAQDRLIESGEDLTVHQQHFFWYYHLAEEAEPHLWGQEDKEWFKRLTTEIENLRGALYWSLVRETQQTELVELGARMAASLWYFFYLFGALKEGRSWLAAGLKRIPQKNQTRARLLRADGTFIWQEGNISEASKCLQEAMDIFRELQDQANLAEAIHMYGHAVFDQQNYTEAERIYKESLALYETMGNQSFRISLISDLGLVACHQGNLESAQRFYKQSLALCIQNKIAIGEAASYIRLGDISRQRGDYEIADKYYQKSLEINRELKISLEIACSLHKLGFTALRRGEIIEASSLFRESLDLQHQSGNQQGIAECLAGLASVEVHRGEYENAARYFAAAKGILTRTGLPMAPADIIEWQRDEALARSGCDACLFEQAWKMGTEATVDKLVQSLIDQE